jgi:glutamate racemase
MLGIVDWGIGGVDFFRRLRAHNANVPVVYFSDAGSTPYGRLPRAALLSRLERVVAAVAERGVTHVVVACNAASTVLPSLASPVPVVGVIEHGIRAALATSASRIGVIGGTRTIRSGCYRRALTAGGRTVTQRVAQPLSGRVEAGDLGSRALRREIAQIVAPLRNVDALLLACTHYPALAPRFRDALPGVHLIDPVKELLRSISSKWTLPRGSGETLVLTTGDARAMRHAAKIAFDVTLHPRRVTI